MLIRIIDGWSLEIVDIARVGCGAMDVSSHLAALGVTARLPTHESYMRRATNTVNFSSELPLAQGIPFA